MSSVGSTLRIAYFGLPLGALALARAGFTPNVIAIGHPEGLGMRRVRRGLSRHALTLAKPALSDARLESALGGARPDAILSWFWPRRIPESVLAMAPRGAFGVHPSLLPRWRGPDPYFWALYADDRETGVTLHRLASDYDTGSIVASARVSIEAEDDAWRLAKKLDRPGLALLVECARRLSAGEPLSGTPQPSEGITDAPVPGEPELEIRWGEPSARILALIRAAAPFPGASTTLADHAIDVVSAQRFDGPLPRALEPADAVLAPEGVVVRTGDAGVLLRRVRTSEGVVLSGLEIADLFEDGIARLPVTRSTRPGS